MLDLLTNLWNQPNMIPYGLTCLGIHIVLYILFAYVIKSKNTVYPWNVLPSFSAHQVLSLGLMIQWSYVGVTNFAFSNFGSVFEVSEAGLWMARCATGALWLWDIPVNLLSDGMHGDLTMHLHHVGMLIISTIVMGLWSGETGEPLGSTYAPFFFGVIEISSIPLQIVDVFHPKQVPWHEFHFKYSFLQQINEGCRILFALSFLVIRGLVFPYVIFSGVMPNYYRGAQERPEFALPLYTVLTLGVAFTFLQLYWTTLIVKQVQKALKGGDDDDNDKETKKDE